MSKVKKACHVEQCCGKKVSQLNWCGDSSCHFCLPGAILFIAWDKNLRILLHLKALFYYDFTVGNKASTVRHKIRYGKYDIWILLSHFCFISNRLCSFSPFWYSPVYLGDRNMAEHRSEINVGDTWRATQEIPSSTNWDVRRFPFVRTAVVANVWESQVASQSSSSESSADEDLLTSSQLPIPAEDFFKSVSQEGYPKTTGEGAKVQPWRALWDGPQQPSKDGKLIVACPQTCTYGRQTYFSIYSLIEQTWCLTNGRA